MTNILASATTGRKIVPVFALIHGVDGIGKSTFAAQAPKPLFLGIETGSLQLEVTRLPSPETYSEFISQLTAVRVEPHSYKTLVVDSLDWLEPIIFAHIVAESGCGNIEKYEGGFSKGYIRALDFWRDIIRILTILQRKMHIVLIAHTLVKKFDDPEQNASYDRYLVGIHEKAASLLRQAVDVVLFCNYKTKVVNIRSTPGGQTGKGKGSAERVMYTEHRPAFDAKNRFELPFEMPLDWRIFGEAIKAFYAKSAPPAPEPPKPLAEQVIITPAAPAEPPPQPAAEPSKEAA